MSLQALLYDTTDCEKAPVGMIEESVQALEVTGNSHLLYIPTAMLPQCSTLYVNAEQSPFQVTLAAPPRPATDAPYLQLSAYLQDECGDAPDAKVSLLADESIHPLGQFAPETIQQLTRTLNPDTMQTLQFNEDQTPVLLYYKATETGTITIYNSADGTEASQILNIPLQQFMDTCFSQDSPFPGFQSEGLASRGQGHASRAFQGLMNNAVGSKPIKPHGKEARDAGVEEIVPDVDHVASLFSGFNNHVRSRSEQGLSIAFQITSSTGPQNTGASQETLAGQNEKPKHGRPKHGSKHGKPHGPKHDRFRFIGPCEQSAALVVLALVAALVMLKIFMTRRRARQAAIAATGPQMQERPVEKKNKDYVAVPTQSV